MTGGRDLIDLVELAYRLNMPDDRWLRELAAASGDCLHSRNGTFGFYFDKPAPRSERAASSARIPCFGLAFIDVPRSLRKRIRRSLKSVPHELNDALRERSGCTLLSELTRMNAHEKIKRFHRDHVHPWDLLSLHALNPGGGGIALNWPLREIAPSLPRTRSRMQRIGSHLTAALRLRHRLRANPKERTAGAPAAEAILSPSGDLLHAETSAKGQDARAQLRRAAIAIDLARGRLRTSDPDAALALWQGLVSGRWSLVDRFESDGRRYYVAHPNPPQVEDPRGLSPAERAAVACAADGHSDKRIAHALGLSRGAVVRRLSSARKKLGVGSRSELIALVTQLGLGQLSCESPTVSSDHDR
jgi:DNA-binding CsgD family transcriptional regulator